MNTIFQNKRTRSIAFVVIGIFLALAITYPLGAFGQVTIRQAVGTTFGLGSLNLEETIIRVVQWALGLLGLVAVIIIMYGGFLWMTARGNEEQVRKAKKVITQAVIGLIIILLAWAIVTFVVNAVTNSTTGTGTIRCSQLQLGQCVQACDRCMTEGDPPVRDNSCNPFCFGGAASQNLTLKWKSPTGTNEPICTIIQAQLSEKLDDATVNSSNIVITLPNNAAADPSQRGLSAGQACAENKNCLSGLCNASSTCEGGSVAGTFTTLDIDGNPTDRFKFQPSAEFEKDALYEVRITTDLMSLNPPGLRPPLGGYSWTFETGTLDDTEPPVVLTGAGVAPWPENNTADICLKSPIGAYFSEEMDTFTFSNNTVDMRNVGTGAKVNVSGFDFWGLAFNNDAFSANPATQLTANTEYEVTLVSGNPNDDTGSGIRDRCGNPLNGDGSTVAGVGVVEYPHPNASGTDDYARDPKGQFNPPGDPDWIFKTGETANCVPEITNISPATEMYGMSGNPRITITGKYLYPNTKVSFNRGVTVPADLCFDANWIPRNSCTVAYAPLTSITTQVPAGAITNGSVPNGAEDGNLSVSTTVGTSTGVFFGVNSPHARAVSPTSGAPGQWVNIIAANALSNMNFGTYDAATSKVLFRRVSTNYNPADDKEAELAACAGGSWKPGSITILVPSDVIEGEVYAIQVVRRDGLRSNLILFQVNNNQLTPGLCPISNLACGGLAKGNPNETLQADGFSFGTAPGTVNFQNQSDGTGFSLNPISWTDSTINFRLPGNIATANYWVTIATAAGPVSGIQTFGVPCDAGPRIVYSNICNAVGNIYPSPNPYPENQNVCVNLRDISFDFDSGVSAPIIAPNASQIHLYRCNSGKNTCNTDFTEITLNAPIEGTGYSFSTMNFDDGNAIPIGDEIRLSVNTWYKFVVDKTVRDSVNNIQMGSDAIWYFKTKNDATPCKIDTLNIDYTGHSPLIKYFNPVENKSDGGVTVFSLAVPTQGSSCNVLVPIADRFQWSTVNPTLATCSGNCNVVNGQILTSSSNEGKTQVRVTYLDDVTAQRDLTVQQNYCDVGGATACQTTDLSTVACNSTCDRTLERCVPHITTTSPASGPAETGVTINGCYFGGTPGQVVFKQAGSPDQLADIGICGPVGSWTNNRIIAGAPEGFAINTTADIEVQSLYSGNFLPSDNRGQFLYQNTCGGQIPPTLCSISPTQGTVGTTVTYKGADDRFTNFPVVKFHNNLNADNIVWSFADLNTIRANAPAGFETGPTHVEINGCSSNAIDFTKTCKTNAQCGNPGCCIQGACTANLGLCSTGTLPGESCQISGHSDITCQYGPTTAASTDYVCISNTGYTAAKAPPPPPQGTQCQFCCDPDVNNDNNHADAQVSSTGLVCVAQPSTEIICPSIAGGETRGLYCGCEVANENTQCGLAFGCSTKNEPTGQQCCRPRPELNAIGPSPIICLNQAIDITFKKPNGDPEIMDPATMNATTITVHSGGVQLDGTYQYIGSGVSFHPKNLLTPGATVTVNYFGSDVNNHVANIYGISPRISDSETIQVNPTATLCNIADIDIRWTDAILPNRLPPSLYTCARNTGCPGDFDGALNGNQHRWFTRVLDAQGTPLTATMSWSDVNRDPADVYNVELGTCPSPTPNFSCLFTATGNDGRGYIDITADGGSAGTRKEIAAINAFMCDDPWPRNNDPVTFPYTDTDYNFSLQYCRNGLPTLWFGNTTDGTTAPLIKSYGAPQVNVDELMRQYVFFVTDDSGNKIGKDAIGIRIMQNELKLPPDLWYERNIGEKPNGSRSTIDGFPAMTIGRSTYISAVNIVGGTMYPMMYIFSWDGDSSATQAIYNQLLSNLKLTVNVGTTLAGTTLEDNQKIRTDTARVQELFRTALLLSDSKKTRGTYPTLESGTFLSGSSTSVWPSWQQTLGAILGATTPKDPINQVGACIDSTAEQNTCWNEAKREFKITSTPEDPSHIFYYRYTSIRSYLFARLDYEGPGRWTDGAVGAFMNPCQDIGGGYLNSHCRVFNYCLGSSADPICSNKDFESMINTYQTVGIPDTTPPNISASTIPANITALTTLSVTATDAGSGISRAEFYIHDTSSQNGILRYVDNSNPYTWDFNPAPYADGAYKFEIKVIDNAGNIATTGERNVTINKTDTDQTPPRILSFNPAQGATLSGKTVNFSATVADNVAIERVEYYYKTTFLGSCITGVGPCSSAFYQFVWDSTTIEDTTEPQPIYAVAFDTSGNTAFLKHDITIDNGTDFTGPFVQIQTPTDDTDVPAGSFLITAIASDASGIANLEAFVNGASITGTATFPNPDNTDPYNWTFNSITFNDNDPLIIRVVARDNQGNSSFDEITIRVDKTSLAAPVALFLNPTDDNSIFAPGLFEAYAEGPSPIQRVELWIDAATDVLIGTATLGNPYRFSWDYSKPDGTYTLYVKAYDNTGVQSAVGNDSQLSNIIIDTTPPVVESVIPTSNTTISGTINVQVRARDSNGLDAIGFVSMYNTIGKIIGRCYPTGSPTLYTCTIPWDTTTIPDNTADAIGFAIDKAGLVGQLRVEDIIVKNAVVDTAPPVIQSLVVASERVVNGRYYVTGPTTITANVSDNVAVAEVAISVRGFVSDILGNLSGTGVSCNASPCTVQWSTTRDPNNGSISDGNSITLAATAADTSSNAATPVSKNVIVDNSPPTIGAVADDGACTADQGQLYATWTQASEPHDFVPATPADVEYFYSIGTSPGDRSTLDWTSAGFGTLNVTRTGLSLQNGQVYWINVKAMNGSGLESNVVSTDGILVDNPGCGADLTPPTLSISFNPQYPAGPAAQLYTKQPSVVTINAVDTQSNIDYVDVFVTQIWNGVTYMINQAGAQITPGPGVHTCTGNSPNYDCVINWNPVVSNRYRMNIGAADVIGNVASLIQDVYVDSVIPVGGISVPQTNWFIGGSYEVRVLAADNQSGINNTIGVNFSISVDGGASFTLFGNDKVPVTNVYSAILNSAAFCASTCNAIIRSIVIDNLGNTANLDMSVRIDNTGAINCGTAQCTIAAPNCCSEASGACSSGACIIP